VSDAEEEKELRATLLRNAQSILEARRRAEEALVQTKEALEERTRELDAEKRALELLDETARAIGSTLEVETLLERVTEAATKLSGAKFGAFFYNTRTPTGDAFLLYTLSGAPREAFEKLGLPRATPIFAPTFHGEGVVRSDDVTKDARYGQWAPHHGMPAGHLPVRSYLAVPVVSRAGEVFGGLFFGHPEVAVFDERAERLVTGIAAHAAVAIDNARLYEQAKHAAEERAQLLESERRTRAELERVSLMKDEFLATLSHELRTPLNAVLGWCELLLAETQDAKARRGLEIIERNARGQARMIDDLLDMNRIIAGKMRLDVVELDLAAVVESAVESIRPSAEAKEIRIRKIVDTSGTHVYGDPHRLQQVVWNLVSNAVKFTPKGGWVNVRVERVNSHVEIIVEDSGIGIPGEVLPHIFDRFRQADSSTTRRFGGLGLGLAIVRQLVDLHGGTVHAQSAGDGAGTRFVVKLPLGVLHTDRTRAHPTAELSAPRGPTLSLAGLRVLVIDDEADARALIKAALESRDAQVLTATSVDEGLACVRTDRPHIVLSDIGMPGRDGYDFVHSLRALPEAAGGRTPAVALTAFARSEDRTRAMLAGYQLHLAKPVKLDELVATVASLTGRTSGA
jgi:signal transduction histidine kinase/ActR/RegA family two-component response regulator